VAQLGKYQLVAEIARGGMGIVSLAVAQGPAGFSKLLVVKELKPELVEDASFLEMFLEEARLAARLNHPNIVQTNEIGAEGKRHFMVMDYLEGVTLEAILRKKHESFTLAMQLRVFCETLAALEYAHTLKDFDGTPLGIVHRDATPQNVFLTFDGTVKLVDFGIAKARDSVIETRAGVLKGKPAYMAPEQVSGQADPRADVFAVGVMLWEAVVGRRMWHKKGDVEVLTNIIKGQIPTLRETKPDAPEALLRICDRALAKNREDRFPSAAAFQAEIEGYLATSNTNPATRDVGKVVADVFAVERARTRSVIEQHLASVKAGRAPEKPPSLPPQLDESMSTPSDGRARVPRLGDPPTFTPAVLAGTPGATAMPARSDAAARRKMTNVLSFAVPAGLALVGTVFAVLAFLPGRRAHVAPAAVPVASSSPSVAPPAVPATHVVSLRVSPPNARISIEGVAVSNPGTRTCMQGQPLMMHASAANYLSTDRELRCEDDESVDVSLVPEPTVDAAPPPVAPRRR
jgi:serine/threonine-protein kinase